MREDYLQSRRANLGNSESECVRTVFAEGSPRLMQGGVAATIRKAAKHPLMERTGRFLTPLKILCLNLRTARLRRLKELDRRTPDYLSALVAIENDPYALAFAFAMTPNPELVMVPLCGRRSPGFPF